MYCIFILKNIDCKKCLLMLDLYPFMNNKNYLYCFQKITMKKSKVKNMSNLRILIIYVCGIMVWKAVRDFCDMFIFPNNIILSDITCFVV